MALNFFWKKEKQAEKRDFGILLRIAAQTPGKTLEEFNSSLDGLSTKYARRMLRRYGPNKVVREEKKSILKMIVRILLNPIILLMLLMAGVSFFMQEFLTVAIILALVAISAGLDFVQELKADQAAQKLKAMVQTTATVVRDGQKKETPVQYLVPGDIVHLSTGDIVPADVRIISSKDLFVNQSLLTGESLPVEKHAEPEKGKELLELQSICFMGTSVESGTAIAIVVQTGRTTYFASISEALEKEVETEFDKGMKNLTWLMLRLIAIMAPLVLILNGLKSGDWLQAFLFAIAIVAGLTPELLPMIITVSLSHGAVRLSQKKTIVKRLNSMQNFGAIDVFCTDKTGTLTEGRVVLERHVDPLGNESEEVLHYAYLNSYYQTGLKNIIDEAIIAHENLEEKLELGKIYRKVDEIAFDFQRKRMSVVVEKEGKHILICKGAVEEMLNICTSAKMRGRKIRLKGTMLSKMQKLVRGMNEEGFRVIAIAYKEIKNKKMRYSSSDENELTLVGFAAFLDPPKQSAAKTISELKKYGITVKILTGDNEIVARKVCGEIGLSVEKIMLGSEIEKINDNELSKAVENVTVFAKLTPAHKERIISALRKNGHVVGFMGDGINDAPALKAADVGISVDNAADIAKESSDIILLEKDLVVLRDGVVEGRRVFGNIDKYIKMAASSNFGNVFSVVGASIFVPFLPMLPLQILVNNLLYDFSQITIPTDEVDKEWLEKPRKWNVEGIQKFILLMGPVSSLFDFLTFAVLAIGFGGFANPALFRTGWFVESLITQTLIIHIIRTNKLPFLESMPSIPLLISSLIITLVAIALPFSPIASYLGFVALPTSFLGFLGITLLAYFGLAHALKSKVATP